MNSHADHIRCQFVNIEAISQVLGANLNRFNPLRVLHWRIEEYRSENPN